MLQCGFTHYVIFICDSPWRERRIGALLTRLPPLAGKPLRIQAAPGLTDRRGPVHAGSFIRRRGIAFSCAAPDFGRIFLHELFHFAWVRLGNALRREWDEVLRRELARGVRGELGWSAEWRKNALGPEDAARRSRKWREYCCEAFCDTAAWVYSGMGGSVCPEHTLAQRARRGRRTWFERRIGGRTLSV
jgi:hypothetical protein